MNLFLSLKRKYDIQSFLYIRDYRKRHEESKFCALRERSKRYEKSLVYKKNWSCVKIYIKRYGMSIDILENIIKTCIKLDLIDSAFQIYNVATVSLADMILPIREYTKDSENLAIVNSYRTYNNFEYYDYIVESNPSRIKLAIVKNVNYYCTGFMPIIKYAHNTKGFHINNKFYQRYKRKPKYKW